MSQEYRKDGWPLCPRCEDDELYSFMMIRYNGQGEQPTLEQCFTDEFRCYHCNWQGRIQPQSAVAVESILSPATD